MKVGICDDNPKQLAIIKANMEQYALDHQGYFFEIDYFNKPFELLNQLEKTVDYDILLLDIYMPGILGTDIAKQVRAQKGKSEIIFLTTSQDYAVEAFALKAAHYIVKPFTKEQFTEALDRAVKKVNHKKSESINIKTQSGHLRVTDLSQIIYVESFRHTQTVYLKSGEIIEARETLGKLLTTFEEASKGQFMCPYKGFIVNMKNISGIEPDGITMKNGKMIPIVKRNFINIKQQYFSFMFTKEDE